MLKAKSGAAITLNAGQLAELLSTLEDDSLRVDHTVTYSLRLKPTNEAEEEYEVVGIVKLPNKEIETPVRVKLAECACNGQDGESDAQDYDDYGDDDCDFSDEAKPAPLIAALLGFATIAAATVFIGVKMLRREKR